MGILGDKGEVGLGKRSWRSSMLVNAGHIEKIFIKPNKVGDPFNIADADAMLAYLDPSRRMGAMTMFARPDYPFCVRAEK